jgi:hypothetical protein
MTGPEADLLKPLFKVGKVVTYFAVFFIKLVLKGLSPRGIIFFI